MTTKQPSIARLNHVAVAAALALGCGAALALPTVNLTGSSYNTVAASNSGTISNSLGTVTFNNSSFQPTGTGVFNPFLRLDVKGNSADEQGYNTSATRSTGTGNNVTTRKILDNMSPVNWTHDVLISDLELTADGKYYQFQLDINEPGGTKSLISLDGLKLYSTATPSPSDETLNSRSNLPNVGGDWQGLTGSGSTLLWDMDLGSTALNDTNDRSVLLDATLNGGPGSGRSDMVMLVDKAVIDLAIQTKPLEKYFVLWSRFGLEQAANTSASTADAGFEEWSYKLKSGSTTPPNPGGGGGVPTPGTMPLALLALMVLGFRQRAVANKASFAA